MNTFALDRSAQSPTALIIEDDPHFSELLATHLQAAGYQPVPYAGQTIAAAGALQPALITLNIHLPDLTGWHTLREIRNAPGMEQVPVLIISALEEVRPGGDFGPTICRQKPIRRAELIEAITALAPPATAPTRVLLVDDDPLLVEMIDAMLPPARFAVQSAAGAPQAADRLNADLPDVILLDLIMPKVSGPEFLQVLRADPRTRHLPVLVLTAKHLSAQEQRDLSQAAQVVLTKKMFTPERLMEKLHYLKCISQLKRTTGALVRHETAVAADVDMAQFFGDFLIEARGHLASLQRGLEQGEELEHTAWLADAARAVHTLKSDAGMMNYTELSRLAGQAENLLAGADAPPVLDALRRAVLRDLHRQMQDIVDGL
ncbi:MAG TPA: response regulator [Anaerolineae bacterium]|nr:response regulator [Anaerolineae bacterium]